MKTELREGYWTHYVIMFDAQFEAAFFLATMRLFLAPDLDFEDLPANHCSIVKRRYGSSPFMVSLFSVMKMYIWITIHLLVYGYLFRSETISFPSYVFLYNSQYYSFYAYCTKRQLLHSSVVTMLCYEMIITVKHADYSITFP